MYPRRDTSFYVIYVLWLVPGRARARRDHAGAVSRHRRSGGVLLPDRAGLAAIYAALFEWALSHPRPYHAMCAATMITTAFESGLRPNELLSLDWGDQILDPAAGQVRVKNPIAVHDARSGRRREVALTPYGFKVLNRWLTEVRPLFAPPGEGRLFPAIACGADPSVSLSTDRFHAMVHPALAYLKARRLVHPSFTFQRTRTTFIKLFLEEGCSVEELSSQLGHRWPPSPPKQ